MNLRDTRVSILQRMEWRTESSGVKNVKIGLGETLILALSQVGQRDSLDHTLASNCFASSNKSANSQSDRFQKLVAARQIVNEHDFPDTDHI